MRLKKASVLIITGYGLNCQEETLFAFKKAGADNVEKIHLNDIIEDKTILSRFNIIAMIGGFSFGDHIAAGKVMANKIKYKLADRFRKFVEEKGLIIGICNGFQELVKLGLLPAESGVYFEQTATLTENVCGHFYDGWVRLKVNEKSPSIFTKGVERLYLPVRHGEGRIMFKDEETFKKVLENNQIVFQYIDEKGDVTEKFPHNPNGSVLGIAGLTDKTGHILGLMPHPEAYVLPYTNPEWTYLLKKNSLPEEGDGLILFENAVSYAKENL